MISILSKIDETTEWEGTPLTGLCRASDLLTLALVAELLEKSDRLATLVTPKDDGATPLYGTYDTSLPRKGTSRS